MNVRFIHKHDRTRWLALDKVFDIRVRCERARWIVRRANIKKPGVRRRGKHCLHIVCIRGSECRLHNSRAGNFCGVHAGLIARISCDVTSRRGSKR